MTKEHKSHSENIGLINNLGKTETMTTMDNKVMQLGNQVKENVEDYSWNTLLN